MFRRVLLDRDIPGGRCETSWPGWKTCSLDSATRRGSFTDGPDRWTRHHRYDTTRASH